MFDVVLHFIKDVLTLDLLQQVQMPGALLLAVVAVIAIIWWARTVTAVVVLKSINPKNAWIVRKVQAAFNGVRRRLLWLFGTGLATAVVFTQFRVYNESVEVTCTILTITSIVLTGVFMGFAYKEWKVPSRHFGETAAQLFGVAAIAFFVSAFESYGISNDAGSTGISKLGSHWVIGPVLTITSWYLIVTITLFLWTYSDVWRGLRIEAWHTRHEAKAKSRKE